MYPNAETLRISADMARNHEAEKLWITIRDELFFNLTSSANRGQYSHTLYADKSDNKWIHDKVMVDKVGKELERLGYKINLYSDMDELCLTIFWRW